MRRTHRESHLIARIGWLRAAVLGANDGIISTASLILRRSLGGRVAKQRPDRRDRRSGRPGRCPWRDRGYVSVSSQSDTEQADLARERGELVKASSFEKEELAQVYVARGVESGLARQVAGQLMAKDALGAHAHDELGISDITTARPIQAALTSAVTFSVGAGLPLALTAVSPSRWLLLSVAVGSLLFLASLGIVGAKVGGAEILKPTIRVTFWGALAMAVTTGIGALFGKVV